MYRGGTPARFERRGVGAGVIVALGLVLGVAAPASAAPTPNLAAAVHYLTTTTGANGVHDGTSLGTDGYYESFPGFADFGLTVDGAFALAAAGTDNPTLRKVVDLLDHATKDPSGQSVNDWTGIGTAFATGGSIGKEALLAEATGFDPRHFGGHDLIAALDGIICTTADVANGCSAPGNFLFATSTFAQASGIIAQLRAGDHAGAAPAIAYLETLQNSDGAWPSLLPSTGDADVDSTAMAAMALALVGTDPAATAAVTKAETWIAQRQRSDGGFTGTAGESTNSAALAIQGLSLAGPRYATQIAKAASFLAGEQNADGGFDVGAGQSGSDVRASAQVVGGFVGTSFGTLSDDVTSSAGWRRLDLYDRGLHDDGDAAAGVVDDNGSRGACVSTHAARVDRPAGDAARDGDRCRGRGCGGGRAARRGHEPDVRDAPAPRPGRTVNALRRGGAAALMMVMIVLGGVITAASVVAAGADPIGNCSTQIGTIVAVDFSHFGGPVVRGCGVRAASGYALLHAAGFVTSGDVHDGPGFVCRVGNAAFGNGTQYPTPSDDRCVLTPPANASWAFWVAPAGQRAWTYSPRGAMSDVPQAGAVELWTFGGAAGTAGPSPPTFGPDAVRAENTEPVTVPHTTASTRATTPPTTAHPMNPAGASVASGPSPSGSVTTGSTRAGGIAGTGTTSTSTAGTKRSAAPSVASALSTTIAPTAGARSAALAASSPKIVDAQPAPRGGASAGSAFPLVIALGLIAGLGGAAAAVSVRRRRAEA